MRYRLHVLAAVDVNFSAIHVRTRIRAQHVNDLGNFVRRAETLERDLLDNLFGAGRKNGGVDFAGCDSVDADSEAAKVTGHFAGQGGEGRL